jgi:UDP-N-acetyl-D-mannosaminuronic acid dehydrogenase
MKRPDIAIVGGGGHVGLPLALVFADKGRNVLIYDINANVLEQIARGEMPFMEQGAAPLLKKVLAEGRLQCSNDPLQLSGVPAVVVTIGTPVDEFLNPALKPIEACVNDLLPFLSDGQLLILRSTVYPGTTEWLGRYLESKGKAMQVAFCPERVVEGRSIEEVQTFPQIVSGTTPEAEAAAASIFRLITKSVVPMAPMEAEFAKLFSNTYRYIHFAIANQFYMMATAAGLDFSRVVQGMQKDYSRMRDFPRPGFTAGPCLFKDTMQLVAFSNNQFSLGHVAMLINEGLPLFLVDQLEKKYSLGEMTIGLLGMAFKADSDDMRSSLSYKLKKILSFRAKKILTTDPYVTGDPDLKPLKDVLAQSDLLILCAPHTEYKDLRLDGAVVIDVWNFLSKTQPALKQRMS